MSRREAVGRGINWFLVILLLAAAPLAAWWAYGVERNSDGAWDDAMLLVLPVVPGALVVVFLGAVALLAYRLCRSRRWLKSIALCLVLLVVAYCVGAGVGRYVWQKEFWHNRQLANQMVAEVEAYRKANGRCPGELSDIKKQLPTQLRRGRAVHELEYQRMDSTGFVLRYVYGWYVYTYDSQDGVWRAAD